MRALWAASWLGFGLLGGIVLKTALDELERRAGYVSAPLAAPSIKVVAQDLDPTLIGHSIQQHLHRHGRNLA